MDNLSCMIVLFGGGEIPGPEQALLPGPFVEENAAFQKAYTAMAEHVGCTCAQSIEMRYDIVKEELTAAPASLDKKQEDELREEIRAFGDGPPEDLQKGSVERTEWFEDWLQEHGAKG